MMEKKSLGVHEFIEELIKEGIWGSVTFNFEAGEIKTIRQDLVWKMKDLYEVFTEPAEGINKPLPKSDRPPRKRLVIRPQAGGTTW